MKINKKIMMLVAATVTASCGVSAKMDFVAFDSAYALHNTKPGMSLKNTLENEAKGLQKQQQELVSELQKAGQEFQKKSKLLSKSAQELEIARLQKMEKKAQHQLQEASAEFQEAAKLQQEMLHRHNLEIAANLAEEKGWGLLVDKASAIAVNSKLDVTEQIIERINAEYDAQQAILVAQNETVPASEAVVA